MEARYGRKNPLLGRRPIPERSGEARTILVKQRERLIHLRNRLVNGPPLPRAPLAETNRLHNPTAQRVITLQMAIEELEEQIAAMDTADQPDPAAAARQDLQLTS